MLFDVMTNQAFHLSCPYTSLPVCQCRLHTPAPPRYARTPFKTPRPPRESQLRRALLLDIIASNTAPPGNPQIPPPELTRALHSRAAWGKLPPDDNDRTQRLLAAVVRAADMEKEHNFVQVAERERNARERVERAREELERLEGGRADSRAGRNDASDSDGVEPQQAGPEQGQEQELDLGLELDQEPEPEPEESESESEDDSDEEVVVEQLVKRSRRRRRATRGRRRRR